MSGGATREIMRMKRAWRIQRLAFGVPGFSIRDRYYPLLSVITGRTSYR